VLLLAQVRLQRTLDRRGHALWLPAAAPLPLRAPLQPARPRRDLCRADEPVRARPLAPQRPPVLADRGRAGVARRVPMPPSVAAQALKVRTTSSASAPARDRRVPVRCHFLELRSRLPEQQWQVDVQSLPRDRDSRSFRILRPEV
jgi:hypothetical protein